MVEADVYIPRLKKLYNEKIASQLLEELKLDNKMQVPRLSKVVINMGVGGAVADSNKLKRAVQELTLIAGQKPVVTRAKNSIAGFKLRAGMPLGCKVTLRRFKMVEFIDRVINIALPRSRDFSGLSPKSFDGNGNYSFGISEVLVFNEIDYDDLVEVRGMDITVCTTTDNDDHAYALLRALNFPFFAKRK